MSSLAATAGTLLVRARRIVVPRNLLAAAALLVALAAGYGLWLRNSSLFAIETVEVTGLSGESEEITATLIRTARGMTTLNVDEEALADAAAAYPTVRSLSADAHLPDGITITVVERPAVAVVAGGGREVAVSGDGILLEGLETQDLEVPAIEAEAPRTGRLEGEALEQALVLGDAPVPLRPAIERSSASAEHGIVVELRGGIELRFGDAGEAEAKWTAAAAILADPELDTLTYVDLRVPGRPAVGGAPEASVSAETTPPPEPAPVPTDPATTDPAALEPAAATDPAAASAVTETAR